MPTALCVKCHEAWGQRGEDLNWTWRLNFGPLHCLTKPSLWRGLTVIPPMLHTFKHFYNKKGGVLVVCNMAQMK